MNHQRALHLQPVAAAIMLDALDHPLQQGEPTLPHGASRTRRQLAPDTQARLTRLLLGPPVASHQRRVGGDRHHQAKALGQQGRFQITALLVIGVG